MPKLIQEGSLYFPSQEKLIQTCIQRYAHPSQIVFKPPPPPQRHLKIRLVRPSYTFLGYHTLLIWQDQLNFTAFFSVTAIYLETATPPPTPP